MDVASASALSNRLLFSLLIAVPRECARIVSMSTELVFALAGLRSKECVATHDEYTVRVAVTRYRRVASRRRSVAGPARRRCDRENLDHHFDGGAYRTTSTRRCCVRRSICVGLGGRARAGHRPARCPPQRKLELMPLCAGLGYRGVVRPRSAYWGSKAGGGRPLRHATRRGSR